MHDPYPRPATPALPAHRNLLMKFERPTTPTSPRAIPGSKTFFLVKNWIYQCLVTTKLQHTRVKSEKLHTSEQNILFRLDGGTGNHVTALPHTSNILFFAFIYIPQYVHNSALVWWNCCAIRVDLIYGTPFIFATDKYVLCTTYVIQ